MGAEFGVLWLGVTILLVIGILVWGYLHEDRHSDDDRW